jgi:LacI family transcriptional regulator
MKKNKEVTIYDIAEQLNISSATVSRGLKDHQGINIKTKKKILDMAKKLGYRSNTFASNLRRQKTNTLGVIVPRLNSSFMSDVIAGMERVANEAGYNLLISQSLESEKKEILNASIMFNNRVDGLLVSLAYDTQNFSHFGAFTEKSIPIIFFDRVHNLDKCSVIVIDNFKAANELTIHLIGRGCKKILYVSGNQFRNVYYDRLEGYKRALIDHQLPINPTLIMINDLSQRSGIEVARQVMQMTNMPDAIFITNDLCAATCMLELKKNGIKIPEDIAFAGFNNDHISSLVEPNLTTVDYKGFEMGEMAAQTLINHLNQTQDIELTSTTVMRHELIIRNSSLKQILPKIQ